MNTPVIDVHVKASGPPKIGKTRLIEALQRAAYDYSHHNRVVIGFTQEEEVVMPENPDLGERL